MPMSHMQYGLAWEKEVINELIEKAIIEADERGVKAKELNGSGELYLQKYPKLRLRIVDGSSLAAAVVLKSIPPGTNQVLLCGKLSKVACATAIALCQKGVQVVMTEKQEFHMLKPQIPESAATYLTYSSSDTPTVWIVGGVTDEEQRRASKGTLFVPLSQFPLKKIRKDCTYYATPAMKIPETLRNVHSCEVTPYPRLTHHSILHVREKTLCEFTFFDHYEQNWLPRRVMSAWRVAGIVHALEGWDTHECGDTVTDIEKIWSAAIRHGFRLMTQA
ncbi:Protein ECERIFERUM 1 [Ananas comosus]|uniref:Protein ECERIFERUM 1 n=1 Tax=Ananas comosus TaxID=4615 RepID=A0A199VEM2_ANACO|nr:Protein ECERIFERUM 1 [Ananas comosus]